MQHSLFSVPNLIQQIFKSMPKMPEGEKKEESAESLAEKKEQVISA